MCGASWSWTSPKSVSPPAPSSTTRNQRCLYDLRVSTAATSPAETSCRAPSRTRSDAENPRTRRSVTAMCVRVGSAFTVAASATTVSPSRRKNLMCRRICSAESGSTSTPM